jgi:hypothetical protein
MALVCKKDGIMVLCSWKKKAGGPMPENKTQQELATMCRAMEEMRNETVRERNIECALEMLADGMPYEKVAKYSKLTLEEVKALDTKKPA